MLYNIYYNTIQNTIEYNIICSKTIHIKTIIQYNTMQYAKHYNQVNSIQYNQIQSIRPCNT